MPNSTTSTTSPPPVIMTQIVPQKPRFILTSLESFGGGHGSKEEEEKLPNKYSILCTIFAVFLTLLMIEQSLRHFLASNQHVLHTLLLEERNRQILARHIGVDAVGCFVVAILGWKARHKIFFDDRSNSNNNKSSSSSNHHNRFFQYHPEAVRIMTVFIGFQFKNLIDTLIWNDGPEYVAHHILAIFSASGGIWPGCCHYYAIFYFGLSEASTGILCLLVNFDDDHGVPGLATAFPSTKLILGGLFALSFIVIRVGLWGSITKLYFQDVIQIFNNTNPMTKTKSSSLSRPHRIFLYFNNISLGFITFLQIIWLFEILKVAKTELV